MPDKTTHYDPPKMSIMSWEKAKGCRHRQKRSTHYAGQKQLIMSCPEHPKQLIMSCNKHPLAPPRPALHFWEATAELTIPSRRKKSTHGRGMRQRPQEGEMPSGAATKKPARRGLFGSEFMPRPCHGHLSPMPRPTNSEVCGCGFQIKFRRFAGTNADTWNVQSAKPRA